MRKFNLNKFQLNKWYNFSFHPDNIDKILSEESIIIKSVHSFQNDVIYPLLKIGLINENMIINIIPKASNGTNFRSITALQTIKIKDILVLNDLVLGNYITNFAENYITLDFNEVIFHFRILSHDIIPLINTKILNVEDHINFKGKKFFNKISNIDLPTTMDLYK